MYSAVPQKNLFIMPKSCQRRSKRLAQGTSGGEKSKRGKRAALAEVALDSALKKGAAVDEEVVRRAIRSAEYDVLRELAEQDEELVRVDVDVSDLLQWNVNHEQSIEETISALFDIGWDAEDLLFEWAIKRKMSPRWFHLIIDKSGDREMGYVRYDRLLETYSDYLKRTKRLDVGMTKTILDVFGGDLTVVFRDTGYGIDDLLRNQEAISSLLEAGARVPVDAIHRLCDARVCSYDTATCESKRRSFQALFDDLFDRDPEVGASMLLEICAKGVVSHLYDCSPDTDRTTIIESWAPFVIDRLVSKGVDPNKPCAGRFPLIEVVNRDICSDQDIRKEDLTALVDSGVDVERVVDDHGMTALMHAALAGNSEVCEWLLERVGSTFQYVNRLDNDGMSALMYAAKLRKKDIFRRCAQVLVKHGALTSLTNKNGHSYVDILLIGM